MNEIQHYTPAAEIVPTQSLADMASDLQDHVAALKSADMLAEMIHMTVQAYDGGTDSKGKRRAGRKEAAVAIYHGMQLGWNPLTSLQNIFTVHGVPGMYARAMKALLISKGHQVETVESTTTTATVRAKHAGSAEWEEVTWTIALATQAGYTSNPKYKSDPRGMLYAKALADACRRAAPDVLMGMAFSAEDLELEPIKVESKRMDRPERGPAGLAAALADPTPTPEPIPASAPVGDEFTPLDPGAFLDQVNAATDPGVLRAMWSQAAQLPAVERADMRALIEDRVEAIQGTNAATQEQLDEAAMDAAQDSETQA